jgi:hypothetical protein
MDVQLGHWNFVFATLHPAHKPQSRLRNTQNHAKRANLKYTDSYRVRGTAFAPIATNAWDWAVFGPDVPRFRVAQGRCPGIGSPDHTAQARARNALSFPLEHC